MGVQWALCQFLIDFEKACHSVRKVVLCNILIKSYITVTLVSLIKFCISETYSDVYIARNLSDTSYSERYDVRRCFILIAFWLCFKICHQEGPRKQ